MPSVTGLWIFWWRLLPGTTERNAKGERVWAAGRLQVFEEHLITRHLVCFLDVATSRLGRPPGNPEVLLATFPGEQHRPGLLMVEALLWRSGKATLNLGTHVPMNQMDRCSDLQTSALQPANIRAGPDYLQTAIAVIRELRQQSGNDPALLERMEVAIDSPLCHETGPSDAVRRRAAPGHYVALYIMAAM